jgi:3-deoxy-D-manno-octulosonic-acid transferase
MSLIYHTIIGLAILVALPVVVLRVIFNAGFKSDLLARLRGYKSIEPLESCLWIHAASVGEVRMVKILVSALKKKGETRPIVVSTFTSTGFEQAKKEGFERIFRMPPDFPLWLNPVFDRLHPSLLVLIEAEMWPSLICECKRRGIPVLLVNGRITQKSTDRYLAASFFFKWISNNISFFSMRTKKDADRLLSLGVGLNKIRVDGNIKFDTLVSSEEEISAREVKESNWVVFGSTRPGDEGPVMEAVIKLHSDYPKLKFIIAPRHIGRLSEVKELIAGYGMDFHLHSEQLNPNNARLVLLDQLGELNGYYSKACVAVVGGGFNPRFGGHNIIEPASYGLPVVFGKHMNNFEEEARVLIESGGGIQLNSSADLCNTLDHLLANNDERQRLGKKAWGTVFDNRGAVDKTIELINRLTN